KDLNKEKFKVAYGKSRKSVEEDATLNGNKNAWLMLLKWNIKYLEHKPLRDTIYQAHKDKNIQFLDEISHIINTPLKPHGRVNKELYSLIHKLFDENKSKKEIIQEVYNKLSINIDHKQLKRMGF
ncbi:MAG: hypothetical protein ACYSR0_09885, partial [Planctomycetota bacterium]